MRRVVLRLAFALVVASTVAMFAAGTVAWGILAGIAVAAIIGSRMFVCHHPGPLGLLPPTDHDGTRLPARWFCDACGKEWPAVFDREQRPVSRFKGYDETKATESARRADDLYKRQQAMALKRAGLTSRRAKDAERPSVPERPPAEVVAIEPLRRAK